MKVISWNKNEVKVRLTEPEDAWYLNQIIEKEDLVSSKTLRKLTLGSEDAKTTHVIRPVFLQLNVERTELAGNALRITGRITKAPEDIPLGSYHTLSAEQQSELLIEKQEWLYYHKTQLKEAEVLHPAIIICVFDRDGAIVALSNAYGNEVLARLAGDAEKKEKRALTKQTLYSDIIKALKSFNERYNPQSIILASPAFYKEDLNKQIEDLALRKKIVLATCSSAEEDALYEVLKRPETRAALNNVRAAREAEAVENLLTEIGKNGKAVYGRKQVTDATESGAVELLLVTDKHVSEHSEKTEFKKLNDMFRNVEDARGRVMIISAAHNAGKKLQGLGGIAARLRFKLEW